MTGTETFLLPTFCRRRETVRGLGAQGRAGSAARSASWSERGRTRDQVCGKACRGTVNTGSPCPL